MPCQIHLSVPPQYHLSAILASHLSCHGHLSILLSAWWEYHLIIIPPSATHLCQDDDEVVVETVEEQANRILDAMASSCGIPSVEQVHTLHPLHIVILDP